MKSRQAGGPDAEGGPLRARGYRQAARMAARRALREDLAGYGDLTGSAFAGDGAARVVAREGGTLSGVAALEETAALVEPKLVVEVFVPDGERFAAGDVVSEAARPAGGDSWRRAGAQLPLPAERRRHADRDLRR